MTHISESVSERFLQKSPGYFQLIISGQQKLKGGIEMFLFIRLSAHLPFKHIGWQGIWTACRQLINTRLIYLYGLHKLKRLILQLSITRIYFRLSHQNPWFVIVFFYIPTADMLQYFKVLNNRDTLLQRSSCISYTYFRDTPSRSMVGERPISCLILILKIW